MIAVRKGVFETNSSSSHSVTIKKINRKTSRVGKLEYGQTYRYKPMGIGISQTKFTKEYTTEYEKLCVIFELLFSYFCDRCDDIKISDTMYENRVDKRLSKYSMGILKKYKKFTKSFEYKEFLSVVKEAHIKFEVDPMDFINLDNSVDYKSPVHKTTYTEKNYLIEEWQYLIKKWNYYDFIVSVVFDASVIIRYEYIHT